MRTFKKQLTVADAHICCCRPVYAPPRVCLASKFIQRERNSSFGRQASPRTNRSSAPQISNNLNIANQKRLFQRGKRCVQGGWRQGRRCGGKELRNLLGNLSVPTLPAAVPPRPASRLGAYPASECHAQEAVMSCHLPTVV